MNVLVLFGLAIGVFILAGKFYSNYLAGSLGIDPNRPTPAVRNVEGFVITTLDVAVRLNRYLFEELWQAIAENAAPILKNFWINSGLAVILMWSLAYSNTLAALTLIAVSVWLCLRGKRNWFTVWPAVFMILTTVASLLILLWNKYLPQRNYILIGMDILLLVFAGGVTSLALKTGLQLIKVKASPKVGTS